jgi:hypothetical protein
MNENGVVFLRIFLFIAFVFLNGERLHNNRQILVHFYWLNVLKYSSRFFV